MEPEFVYEIILQEQLNQLTAAPNLDVRTLRFFELFDVGNALEEY